MTKESWSLRSGDRITSDLIALKKLGGGIAYEAFVAFDERLYSPVVVKVVRPDQTTDVDTLTGVDRETAMLRKLNHPAIVRMFSVDRLGDRPHIVLENLDGPNLSALIGKRGALPLQQLLPLGIEIASALHYMREVGICHLDIKPSNIIMGAPAKLIDLSCARHVKEAAELTVPIGTDEYMAPEQCLPGERGEIGFAADMWGFGATMFRAAAGHRAFSRDGEKWQQLHAEPRPLLQAIPQSLAALILACLDKDPAARPLPSEFADALEPLMANLPKSRLSGFKVSM